MKKNEFNFQEIAEMKRREADRIETLEEIYIEIKNSMQWNAMEYHEPDEDHENGWYTIPDEDDDYRYNKYKVFQEVLRDIENMAEK